MPRYFFHLHNDVETHDEDGHECADDGAALDYARTCALELASSSVRKGHLNLDHCVECVAEDDREVGIVRFRDAVKIES